MLKRKFAFVAVLFSTFALMTGAVGGAVAQESTPQVMMAGHPAHIHSGTCDTLGDVVFPLNDLAPLDMVEVATPEGEFSTLATPDANIGVTPTNPGNVVAQSTTTVDVSLEDILAAEHAINVHESAENIGNYIACGDIVESNEASVVDGRLQIQLQELNESGYMGFAMLTDMGDGATEVTVVLQLSASNPMATPEA